MLDLPNPKDDGLPIMPAGPWARNKHYFLARYIDAFTTAMKGKRWSGLHYIDLFAGPGMLRLETTGELEWGSPMIASRCDRLDTIHLCERNRAFAEALDARITRLDPDADVSITVGNANDVVGEIMRGIPNRSLSLAFLDPYGLDLHFETLSALSRRRVDLIVFFPDYVDALRNWRSIYKDQTDSKLDKFLGGGVQWRDAMTKAAPARRAGVLRKLYVDQVRRLGYTEFETERISAHGSPLYLLLFFSHHKAGSDIWRGISGTKPDGQRTLDFG